MSQGINTEESRKGVEQSEKLFRVILEQSPMSTQIFSPEGETLWVNHARGKNCGA